MTEGESLSDSITTFIHHLEQSFIFSQSDILHIKTKLRKLLLIGYTDIEDSVRSETLHRILKALNNPKKSIH